MPSIMGLDLETYSSAPLPRCGVYRYCDAPDFEILLFSYAFDDEPVQTIDLTSGETLPLEVISALKDPTIIKVAYNAQFERVCLSRYLGRWLDPHQWRCTMVMAAYLTLPGRLADAAVALGTTEKKMEEGKDLIRYFSVPCKPTKSNGGRTRNLPADAPEKWAVYRQYNAQDVETERAIRKALEKYPLPEQEWELYALDQQINDRGVRVDKKLVKNAIAVDAVFAQAACQRAKELTGLENPGSVNQLKAWLADQDMPMESLARKIVQEKAAQTDGIVAELLNLRLELSKTSVKKYEAMARCVCRDGRVHGLLQFYGANRTGRWCLTGDHEVLTDKGWLRLDEWHGGRIACWNALSEAISFQKAEQVSFDYAGPMYTYRGLRIDQCSTPDHRMRVQPRYGDPWTDMTVKEMSLRRPCIPFTGYRYHRGCANPSWLRVLIMTQADGHYTADGAVRFHFVKQRKIERCKMLLRKAEIPFVVRQHKERALTIEIPARAVPLWLREFRSKTFGFWLLDENPDIFFDELPHWDGYYSAPNSIQYSTVNKQNADIVQALAHMSGRSCIMKTRKKEGANVNYVLDIWLSPGTCHELKEKPVVEEFIGKIYCAVTSTGYFLVRRNGKVWVTGNSGRLVQVQNLPQNHLPDLELAREIVKTGDEELLDLFFTSVPGTLSELIRTAFIPRDGCRFLVADFSAIEARVLAWLASEEWVLEEFRGKGKIYEATASRMFHIPQESIIKGNPNYEYRQKGKQATLSCIAEGQLVLTDHGLIRIENVKLHHRLWDGENWVSHEGVVYRGQREVMTYDGLTATADHLVWIEGQARPVYFGFAAASGARLIRTEYCGQAISMSTTRSATAQEEQTGHPLGIAHRRTARLYDIRNAGLHHRFTVSGRLVHNCGYGGGIGALKAMGAKMPEEEMQPLVDAWRAANPNIVAFWNALDRAARTVIRRKTSARVGKVILYWQDDKMFMRLPSGRNLCYQSPHFTENRFGSDAIGYYAPNAAGQMVVQEAFGGKLAENATQAIARDILAHALLTLEKNGYPVIFHVHDEAVIEMPIGQGSLEEACRLMAIAPDWAKDLPLRADGYECAYYRKD